MDSWKIKVSIDGENISVQASLNGKRIKMTDETSAKNIAGILAQVSCKMVSHFNHKATNDNQKQ